MQRIIKRFSQEKSWLLHVKAVTVKIKINPANSTTKQTHTASGAVGWVASLMGHQRLCAGKLLGASTASPEDGLLPWAQQGAASICPEPCHFPQLSVFLAVPERLEHQCCQLTMCGAQQDRRNTKSPTTKNEDLQLVLSKLPAGLG